MGAWRVPFPQEGRAVLRHLAFGWSCGGSLIYLLGCKNICIAALFKGLLLTAELCSFPVCSRSWSRKNHLEDNFFVAFLFIFVSIAISRIMNLQCYFSSLSIYFLDYNLDKIWMRNYNEGKVWISNLNVVAMLKINYMSVGLTTILMTFSNLHFRLFSLFLFLFGCSIELTLYNTSGLAGERRANIVQWKIFGKNIQILWKIWTSQRRSCCKAEILCSWTLIVRT